MTIDVTPLAITFSRVRDPERPCALCESPHRLWTGPILVVEGTMDPVCNQCGDAIAPGLMDLVRAADRQWGGVVLGANGELTVEELLTSRRGRSDTQLAAQHAAMIHTFPDEETFPSLRLLEQTLVARGRVDVFFEDNVWEIRPDDPEYVRNEIVRAAYHSYGTVVELERLDLSPTTLIRIGIGVSSIRMLGDLAFELPVPCAVCTESIEGQGPYYLACRHDGLVCATCIERYSLSTMSVLKFESEEQEAEYRRRLFPPSRPDGVGPS
jgi:hypothetical protein